MNNDFNINKAFFFRTAQVAKPFDGLIVGEFVAVMFNGHDTFDVTTCGNREIRDVPASVLDRFSM